MTSESREVAAQVLPHFTEAVLARKQHTYGHYARLIGRDIKKEAITIGPAMHLIGALCVIRQVPVAPLFYLKRGDGEARDVFASDSIEAKYVLPHREMLTVLSREYIYTAPDFDGVSKALQKIISDKWPPYYSPHHMWHQLALKRPKDSKQTYFERALDKYGTLFEELRQAKLKKHK